MWRWVALSHTHIHTSTHIHKLSNAHLSPRTHTHIHRGCGPFALTHAVISQPASARRRAVCGPWQFWAGSVHHTSSSTVNSAEQTSISCCLWGISNLKKRGGGRDREMRKWKDVKNVLNWCEPSTLLSFPSLSSHWIRSLFPLPDPLCVFLLLHCVITCTCNELRWCCDLFVKQAVSCLCAQTHGSTSLDFQASSVPDNCRVSDHPPLISLIILLGFFYMLT